MTTTEVPERYVFVNCPFDEEHAPLLEALLFCIVYCGFVPRLASESRESGENRLDKIVSLIEVSEVSVHDLSRCKAREVGEFARMNMPFEFGVDVGLRRSGRREFAQKKFLIFEEFQYDLKRSLSDVAGQDVAFHKGDFELVIRETRNFFKSEMGIDLPGPTRIAGEYHDFRGWVLEKKIAEGHSEFEALNLPTRELLQEMSDWTDLGRPAQFQS
ncbi:MAG: hypothetical protein VYB54_12475 [Pseudomonadota bacterium]|nr:hypothetical protein [Pseudomonadota bacterium]